MTRFTIYQNQSLSKRGNQMFFLTTCCVSFAIALAFAWQGLWLIVPFAGIEMLALGLALYWCLKRLSRVETITVSDKEVSLNVQQLNRKQSAALFLRHGHGRPFFAASDNTKTAVMARRKQSQS